MRLVPPLFPRRDRLHANLRLAIGLILNILVLWFMLPYADGTIGEMKAVAVACAAAVAVLLPVFFLGGPTQRIIAAVLLGSPIFFLAVVVPTRFTQESGRFSCAPGEQLRFHGPVISRWSFALLSRSGAAVGARGRALTGRGRLWGGGLGLRSQARFGPSCHIRAFTGKEGKGLGKRSDHNMVHFS